MKLYMVMSLALAVAVSAPANAADRLYARVQIDVHEGSNLINTAAAAGYLTAGEPMEHDAGEYRVSWVVHMEDLEAYVLTIELVPSASPERITVQGEFEGRLVGGPEGPLEFSMERGGVKIAGFLALSRVD